MGIEARDLSSSPFFQPFAPVRERPVTTFAHCNADWREVASGRASAGCDDIKLRPGNEYVAGGFNYMAQDVFAHVKIDDDSLSFSGNGSMGDEFGPLLNEYLSDLSFDNISEVIQDQRNGFDVVRELDPKYVQAKLEEEAVRATLREKGEKVSGRPSQHKPEHNPICNGYEDFIQKKIMDYVRSGAVTCLGKSADVDGSANEPLEYLSFTIEHAEGKEPRLCSYVKEVNKHTRDRDCKLETLDDLREDCLRTDSDQHPSAGFCADEKAGFHMCMLSEEGKRYFGFRLFQHTFQWNCVRTFHILPGICAERGHFSDFFPFSLRPNSF